MLLKYIDAGMKRARYEMLPDNEGYYGEVPGLEGVWASADTLEHCREELQSALEDWIIFSLDARLPIPVLDGIDLKPKASAAPKRSRECPRSARSVGATSYERFSSWSASASKGGTATG